MSTIILSALTATLLALVGRWWWRRSNDRGFQRRTLVPPAPAAEAKKEPTPTAEIFVVAREFCLGIPPRRSAGDPIDLPSWKAAAGLEPPQEITQHPPLFLVGQELERSQGTWKHLNANPGSPLSEFYCPQLQAAVDRGWLQRKGRGVTPPERERARLPSEVIVDPVSLSSEEDQVKAIIKMKFQPLYFDLYSPVATSSPGDFFGPSRALLRHDSELVKLLEKLPKPSADSSLTLDRPENPTTEQEVAYIQQIWDADLTLQDFCVKLVQFELSRLTMDLEKKVLDWRIEVARKLKRLESWAPTDVAASRKIDLDEVVRQELARLATAPFAPALSDDTTAPPPAELASVESVFKFMYEHSKTMKVISEDDDEETKVLFPSGGD